MLNKAGVDQRLPHFRARAGHGAEAIAARAGLHSLQEAVDHIPVVIGLHACRLQGHFFTTAAASAVAAYC